MQTMDQAGERLNNLERYGKNTAIQCNTEEEFRAILDLNFENKTPTYIFSELAKKRSLIYYPWSKFSNKWNGEWDYIENLDRCYLNNSDFRLYQASEILADNITFDYAFPFL